jgi:ZIP family zinc transporter
MAPSFEEAEALGGPYPVWLPGFLGFAIGVMAVWLLGFLIPKCTGHDDVEDAIGPAAKPMLDAGTEEPGPATATDTAPAPEDKVMGYNKAFRLALAVFLHNIPEGIAVGLTLGLGKNKLGEERSESISTAIGLAIAIAIHNIPEGLAVALPIRQITGSTLRGFIYGALSGVSEPVFGIASFYVGAALEHFNPWGLAFAGGAMVFVVFDDLVPESWSLDHHRISTWTAIAGFIFILILDIATQ